MSRQFGDFTASEIYCPKCKRSQPVRERLLLVLPSGELHEYFCAQCGASVGTRKVTGVPKSLPCHLARNLAETVQIPLSSPLQPELIEPASARTAPLWRPVTPAG